MLIRKELSGEVTFWRNGKLFATLDEVAAFELNERRGGIEIVDQYGYKILIETSQVRQTQIFPAAAIAFTGTVAQLWTLLVNGFFTELHKANSGGGGGGGLETNILAKGVNYSITTSDYIIYATANNITLRLPTIGANIGQFYRIYANNRSITVACDDPAGDRITGLVSVQLSKWDSATFRAIYSNQWLISD